MDVLGVLGPLRRSGAIALDEQFRTGKDTITSIRRRLGGTS
jgi:hypothetical protein